MFKPCERSSFGLMSYRLPGDKRLHNPPELACLGDSGLPCSGKQGMVFGRLPPLQEQVSTIAWLGVDREESGCRISYDDAALIYANLEAVTHLAS